MRISFKNNNFIQIIKENEYIRTNRPLGQLQLKARNTRIFKSFAA